MKPIPDFVLKKYTDITPEWLKKRNIQAVLTDLDNTLAPYSRELPDEENIRWINSLKAAGIQLAVISNNKNPERVRAFCHPVSLAYAPRAGKPRPDSLLSFSGRLGLKPENMLMLGDQIFTDVSAGKRAGMCTAIVRPLSSNPVFWMRRLAELPFILAVKTKNRV